jgi:hypothetical protein
VDGGFFFGSAEILEEKMSLTAIPVEGFDATGVRGKC